MTPFLPGATDHHLLNALRFWPTTSSTSGMSASGHDPVAPSGPEAMVTFCMTSANTRTFAAGMVAPPSPVKGCDQAYEVSFNVVADVAGCRTTIWKPSYSFRAAASVAALAPGRASPGRTFVVPSTTRTVGAAGEAKGARERPIRRKIELFRMEPVPGTGGLA